MLGKVEQWSVMANGTENIPGGLFFNLTTWDIEGVQEYCDFQGLTTGVEDGILIEGPTTITQNSQVSYDAIFGDLPPPNFLITDYSWEISALHCNGLYQWKSGTTPPSQPSTWNITLDELPFDYGWIRDENNNVIGEVHVSATEDDLYVLNSYLQVKISGVDLTTSGTLSHNETWCGDIEITGDVTVPQGISLTILPGTKLSFNNSAGLYVFGTLNVQECPLLK
ncbi:MAG: hypothetical protein O6940_07700 [Ignavibacteria bacterium]|nr:hypothetical protein [Ignavibacteria bacterium]